MTIGKSDTKNNSVGCRMHALLCAAILLCLSLTVPANAQLRVAEPIVEILPRQDITVKTRIALVIGNADYEIHPRARQLKGPVNDAKEMAKVLQKIGFTVWVGTNMNKKEMEFVVDEFAERISNMQRAGVDTEVVFYYSGSGFRTNGCDYLLPTINDQVQDADQFERGAASDWALPVKDVIRQMQRAENSIRVILLDHSRNEISNASGERMRADSTRCLHSDGKTGSLIAHATTPGNVSYESDQVGNGSLPQDQWQTHGFYTKALMKHMVSPEVTVLNVLQRTAGDVYQWTEGRRNRQLPTFRSFLTKPFYFEASTVPLNDAFDQEDTWIAPDSVDATLLYELALKMESGSTLEGDSASVRISIIPGNEAEAYYWYRAAASQGHVPSIKRLASRAFDTAMFHARKAMRRYRRAAAHGDGEAMLGLARTYESTGNDEESSVWYTKALKQLKNAAAEDSAKAMYLLGQMYRYGWGVAEDSEKAEAWFRKAAERGYLDENWFEELEEGKF